ncbi:MAG: DUF1460 domain-containing protein [bacterium]|jgi:hypothetical protein|nr:DUF1460 domain-containing protein [bacterium]
MDIDHWTGARAALVLLLGLAAFLPFRAPALAAETSVEAFAARAAALPGPGPATLVELGRGLLGTPYLKGALRGPKDPATGLVLSLEQVDCMILLEWLLAGNTLAGRPGAGRADSLARALLQVRFRHGRANHLERHHFFGDWLDSGPRLVDAGPSFRGSERRVLDLNRGAAKPWVKGLPCRRQELWWVPPAAGTLDSLRDGDLIGLWAAKPGLDVTHVGIIVREEGRVMLLNASSRAMRVRLEPLAEHPAWKRGILVFRLPGQTGPGTSADDPASPGRLK